MSKVNEAKNATAEALYRAIAAEVGPSTASSTAQSSLKQLISLSPSRAARRQALEQLARAYSLIAQSPTQT